MTAQPHFHPGTPPLRIEGVYKSFENKLALKGVSLTLEAGRILALLGPSGCGKTTLLRCIAGLLPTDRGSIWIGEQVMSAPGLYRPPEARELGMVFQDYALWPHMTVAENVEFPLKMRGIAGSERRHSVAWALDTVGLAEFAGRSPETLSGGQQQRVAMARAIVARPRLLLMDEPLSNLDKGLRESLALDIRRLIKELGLSAVFVTHDQQEAFALADQVAVLQGGELHQIAAPQVLYDFPANAGIATFLGSGMVIPGRFTAQGFHVGEDGHVLPFHAPMAQDEDVTLFIPRRAVSVCGQQATVTAEVAAVVFQGEQHGLRLRLSPSVELTLHSRHAPRVGERLSLAVDAPCLRAWRLDGQAVNVHSAPVSARSARDPIHRHVNPRKQDNEFTDWKDSARRDPDRRIEHTGMGG
ncbi:ABC transporter ATP-binding protein [Zobellella sp. DQSA1]|uniref:ABC transporter ATP-binding protein n=1 Tax=Zobellella sp. DQSA1 TaxID=3342386 RepID=UPI0035C118BC